jgi:hypothetical protein
MNTSYAPQTRGHVTTFSSPLEMVPTAVDAAPPVKQQRRTQNNITALLHTQKQVIMKRTTTICPLTKPLDEITYSALQKL